MGWPLVDFSTSPPYQQIFDYTGSPDGIQPVYVGWATPGVLTSEPKWRIRKFVYTLSSGSYVISQIIFMNGDIGFRQIWDNRASATFK